MVPEISYSRPFFICIVNINNLKGFEYVVKFNLQKHLEGSHSQQERDKPPEQLIKVVKFWCAYFGGTKCKEIGTISVVSNGWHIRVEANI